VNRRTFALAGAAAALGTQWRGAGAATLTPVRMIFDPTFYVHLPLLHAIDSGYFKDEGIDLQITPANGSSTLFLPMLARGEYDLGTVNPSPAFFNQFSGGFDVVLLACHTAAKPGWHDPSWLMVRQDLWDAKAIQQPADLKGHVLDGSNVGSPIDFLLKETIRAGGLTPADVRLGERYHSVGDQLQGLRNKAVDVSGAPEPEASEFEAPLGVVLDDHAVVPARIHRRLGEICPSAARFDPPRAAGVLARQRRRAQDERQVDAGLLGRGGEVVDALTRRHSQLPRTGVSVGPR